MTVLLLCDAIRDVHHAAMIFNDVLRVIAQVIERRVGDGKGANSLSELAMRRYVLEKDILRLFPLPAVVA